MSMFRRKDSSGRKMFSFDEDSKLCQFLLIGKKACLNILKIFRKNIEGAQDEHYDFDVDGKPDTTMLRKQRICNIIFITYGIVAGFFAEEYAEYWCKYVQSFCTGVPITSYEQPPAHVVALLLGIIIIFCVYLAVGAVAGCIYVLVKSVFLPDGGLDEIEMLQIAFMYAVMEVVIIGLLCLVLPWNVIIAIKY